VAASNSCFPELVSNTCIEHLSCQSYKTFFSVIDDEKNLTILPVQGMLFHLASQFVCMTEACLGGAPYNAVPYGSI
jgi:hypothetical protein